MFESVSKFFSKQPEQAQEMSVQPQNNMVAQQPSSNQEMTTDPSKLSMRGGGEGEAVCCGLCAGCCAFECLECCC